jgi:hypothetical protein
MDRHLPLFPPAYYPTRPAPSELSHCGPMIVGSKSRDKFYKTFMLVDIGLRGLAWNITGGSDGRDLWHCCCKF